MTTKNNDILVTFELGRPLAIKTYPLQKGDRFKVCEHIFVNSKEIMHGFKCAEPFSQYVQQKMKQLEEAYALNEFILEKYPEIHEEYMQKFEQEKEEVEEQ